MPSPQASPIPEARLRIYRLALRLYPAAFRRRFGQEMEQVFRAQCRDVAARGSRAAWVALTWRCAIDLLVTAVREHLAERLRRRAAGLPLTPLARLGWSAGAAIGVTVLVLGVTIRGVQSLPREYLSFARVMVHPVHLPEPPEPEVAIRLQDFDPFVVQTEMALILRPANLQRAAEKIAFAERASPQYLGTMNAQRLLQPPEIVAILQDKVSVRQYRNTAMLEIRAYDRDPQLAADLANSVAAAFLELRVNDEAASALGALGRRTTLVDPAEPGLRPIRPNPYLITFVGGVLGLILGLIVALVVWWLLRLGSAPPGTRVPAASA